jgi:hypothetical protein
MDSLKHPFVAFAWPFEWVSTQVSVGLALPCLTLISFELNLNLISLLMTSTSYSPAMPAKSTAEMTPPISAGAQAPFIINGMVVPTGPRADRASSVEDPFVTPNRGIETNTSAAMSESSTAAGSEPQAANSTPTATGFTPRPDRLAEPLSAANAQAVFAPQACVFLAK